MGRSTNRSFRAIILAISLACMGFVPRNAVPPKQTAFIPAPSPTESRLSLYDKLDLESRGLSHEAFEYAIRGYEQLLNTGKIMKENLLSIVDFSLSSDKKRLFVIDLDAEELLFNTYVAHGKNSGKAVATRFSNKPNSFKSSLGFYVTGSIYNGKHGYSLRLEGEERGINDKALSRGIVMHSAAYADEALVEHQGFIGRSLGCPAIPQNVHKQIIETIQDGSCLFMYSPDAYYLSHSKLI